ncbi:MAG: galactose mutarotase [Saprospiraceae bacterium]|nr:galactose mutarotase [Candidatus Defluviibacterium haderslevense]
MPFNYSALFQNRELKYYELINKHQVSVIISNYGARILKINCPDKNGHIDDIVGGFDSIQEYLNRNQYYGAICGRYANRIARGRFTLNNTNFQLDINHPPHHLHGGTHGIHTKIWDIQVEDNSSLKATLKCDSGEMGYPGNLDISLYFKLNDDNQLVLKYEATSDLDTIINLAPHSYFNLGGTENILDHRLQIHAHHITEIDTDCIPTGHFLNIENTDLDFNLPKCIGEDIQSTMNQMQICKGYDHNYVLLKDRDLNKPVAILSEYNSGRTLSIYTSQPGLQLYTCNWGDKTEIGKGNKIYRTRSFVCLEPQHFPDSPNHNHFPTTVLKVNETYSHYTIYEFGTL